MSRKKLNMQRVGDFFSFKKKIKKDTFFCDLIVQF